MSAHTRVANKLSAAQIADLAGDNSKGVSICIPRVFANIPWHRIKKVFVALNWGWVERVDVIPTRGGTKRAFVHFAPGKFTQQEILDALRDGKTVDIFYEHNEKTGKPKPWYWRVSLSHSAKPTEAPKPPRRPVATICSAAAQVAVKPRIIKSRKIVVPKLVRQTNRVAATYAATCAVDATDATCATDVLVVPKLVRQAAVTDAADMDMGADMGADMDADLVMVTKEASLV